MSKNFHLKKNDYEKINGAEKHRFNAEYSDELEFKSKKVEKYPSEEQMKNSTKSPNYINQFTI
jgi:hypothetical protein